MKTTRPQKISHHVEASPLVVPITLENYWHETITREEALRRLANRKLDPRSRARIEKRIPERTEHYLTFSAGGVFREYADFGDGIVSLVCILPMETKGKNFTVIVPARTGRLSGIELNEYTSKGGKLIENGVAKEQFKFSRKKIEVMLDVAFVRPQGHPGGSTCCDACEWVHSALDIHGADWLCCLGCCDMTAAT